MYYLRIQSRAIRRLHFNRPEGGTREAETFPRPGENFTWTPGMKISWERDAATFEISRHSPLFHELMYFN